MFKNECAPSQLMVAYIRPCLLYQGMYRRAYLVNILNEFGIIVVINLFALFSPIFHLVRVLLQFGPETVR